MPLSNAFADPPRRLTRSFSPDAFDLPHDAANLSRIADLTRVKSLDRGG